MTGEFLCLPFFGCLSWRLRRRPHLYLPVQARAFLRHQPWQRRSSALEATRSQTPSLWRPRGRRKAQQQSRTLRSRRRLHGRALLRGRKQRHHHLLFLQARRCWYPSNRVVCSTFPWSSGPPWPKPRSVRACSMSPCRNVFPTTFDPWEGTQVGASDFTLWMDAKADRKSVGVLRTNPESQLGHNFRLCAVEMAAQRCHPTSEAGCADATASICLCD